MQVAAQAPMQLLLPDHLPKLAYHLLSHFVELFAIEDQTKRLFYQHLCASEHWSIRTLRQKQEAMLPDKQWFTDKLHKSIALAQQQKDAQKENGGSQ